MINLFSHETGSEIVLIKIWWKCVVNDAGIGMKKVVTSSFLILMHEKGFFLHLEFKTMRGL